MENAERLVGVGIRKQLRCLEAEKELHAIVSVETVVTHEGYVVIIYCNILIIHTLEANYQAII